MTITANNFLQGIIAAILLIMPAVTIGQVNNADISVSVSPQYVEPGEEVEIQISGELLNLNNKQVIWRKDGSVFASGIGVKNTSFIAGDAGESSVVTIQTRTDNAEIVEKTVIIRPAEVDIIWESESQTPPFYQGKSLHSGWGNITVTAIPNIYNSNGVKINPESLVYNWGYNDLNYRDKSGRGEQSFEMETSPQNNNINLEIETASGEKVFEKTTNIPSSNPEVNLYEKDNLKGVNTRKNLTETIELTDGNFELVAIPYFFPVTNNDVTYEWQLDGDIIETEGGEENSVRFSQQVGASGESTLDISVDIEGIIFPEINEQLSINF